MPKRIILLTRFIDALSKSEVLKSAQVYVAFLKCGDRVDWDKAVKSHDQEKGFNIVTEDGQMDCRNREESYKFCVNLR